MNFHKKIDLRPNSLSCQPFVQKSIKMSWITLPHSAGKGLSLDLKRLMTNFIKSGIVENSISLSIKITRNGIASASNQLKPCCLVSTKCMWL